MGELRKLTVILQPWQAGEKIGCLDVTYAIQGLKLIQGDILAQLHLNLASIPACEFSEAGVVAQDRAGDLPLTVSVGTGRYGPARQWTCGRQTSGPITLRYRVFPREVPETYTSSPYFDLRNEQGGMNGSGAPFMLLLPEGTYEISLHWELSQLPPGSRGVWCKGEGDVTLTAAQDLLAFSYYAAGAVKTWRPADNDRFEFHWLSEPGFDIVAVAEKVYTLFCFVSAFFDDPAAPFTVFARKDPFKKSGGGTALADSFMFGYSEAALPTPDEIQNLLAHEMVHNWPHLDEPEAYRTWYDEGTAEYYSIVLPYRAGLSTLGEVMEQLQQRANMYYGNPFRSMPSEEAVDLYWKDRRTQRIPYSRGLFYILSVDHAIRAASGGQRSVDNVVLALVKQNRLTGEHPHCSDWLDALSRELGRDARPEFEAIHRGELILPDDAWFGGAFKFKAGTIAEYINKWEISQETIDGFILARNPDVADTDVMI
jgi:predicted metalloprotease with PDZ domain